jgi:hypothetical protein
MSQNKKFESSIPNNKLEPVFLGGGSGPSSKSSGTYVPVFLRNQEENDTQIVTNPRVAKKDFKMSEDDFPTISGAKSSSASTTTTETPKIFTNYSDALKKDIDKPRPKSSQQNGNGESNHSRKKIKQPRILAEYSDYDSDDY